MLIFLGWMKKAGEIWEIPGNSPPHILKSEPIKIWGFPTEIPFKPKFVFFMKISKKCLFMIGVLTTPQVLEVGISSHLGAKSPCAFRSGKLFGFSVFFWT